MKKANDWKQVKNIDCCEYLTDGERFVAVTWGYATGSKLGCHNEFDTDSMIHLWTGEPEEFSTDVPLDDLRWEAVAGFNANDPGWDPEVVTEEEIESRHEEELEKVLAQL